MDEREDEMRAVKRLTALAVKRAAGRGMYPDGGGLYLQISKNGSRAWVLRFRFAGKRRHLGLGALPLVSLAEARDRAQSARRLIWEGKDPVEIRRQQRSAARVERSRSITVRKAAERYIDAHKAGWSSDVHARQWSVSLRDHVFPVIGDLPVSAIERDAVMRVLQPVWTVKPETASRIRGRLERILDWCRVQGFRDGENPCRWRGHLENLLPARSKLATVTHFTALPYAQLPEFMVELRNQSGTAARALEFLILTCARTGEVLGATWDEVDLAARLWVIPAERMKAKQEHRIPLSDGALEMLRALPGQRQGIVFQPLAAFALRKLLARMGRQITAHGFRSSFADWATEKTSFPREAIELALAHTVGSAVERAYRRGDQFERRRELMQSWANYVGGATGATIHVLHGTAG
jgi:integrase